MFESALKNTDSYFHESYPGIGASTGSRDLMLDAGALFGGSPILLCGWVAGVRVFGVGLGGRSVLSGLLGWWGWQGVWGRLVCVLWRIACGDRCVVHSLLGGHWFGLVKCSIKIYRRAFNQDYNSMILWNFPGLQLFGSTRDSPSRPCLLVIITLRFTCGEKKNWQSIKTYQNIMHIIVVLFK